MTLSLDAIADGVLLDTLTATEATLLLNRSAAAQARLAARLLELTRTNEWRDVNRHDQLLTAKRAAELLGVAPAWLYRHAAQLPFTIRIGGHVRFSERALERFIGNRTGSCGEQRGLRVVLPPSNWLVARNG